MGSSRRVVVRMSHAQARELMYAAAIVAVDARVYELGVRQAEVLARGRAAIQAALDAQAERREDRQVKAAAVQAERDRRRERWARLVPRRGRRDSASAGAGT